MPKRHLSRLTTATVLTVGSAASLGVAEPSTTKDGRVVRPGESIQAAVDAAHPGDTIVLLPGTYKGSVLVKTPDLTIRGAGAETVLQPATGDKSSCAELGHGICVTGTADKPLAGVRVRSLSLTGFTKSGLFGLYTDRLEVSGVHAHGNGEHGIGQEFSTRALLRDNVSKDNAQAGVFVADAPDAKGTVVSGNTLSGNRLGVQIRRGRDIKVKRNTLTGNCAGVFVVGDETVPRTGLLKIRDNDVHENNKYCEGNSRIAHIQGSGVVLTGAETTEVSGNVIRGHKGDSPMSGGVVLVPSFSGSPNADHVVTNNILSDNTPADLADRDTGSRNSFTGNQCAVSEPAGHC